MNEVLAWLGTVWASLGESAWAVFGLGVLAGALLGIAGTALIVGWVVRRRWAKLQERAARDVAQLLQTTMGGGSPLPEADPWSDRDPVRDRLGW